MAEQGAFIKGCMAGAVALLGPESPDRTEVVRLFEAVAKEEVNSGRVMALYNHLLDANEVSPTNLLARLMATAVIVARQIQAPMEMAQVQWMVTGEVAYQVNLVAKPEGEATKG